MQLPRKLLLSFLLVSLLLAACGGPGGGDGEISLRFSGTATGRELVLTNEALRRFMAANPDIHVSVVPTPQAYEDRLALYQELFAGGNTDADIYQIDVVWVDAMEPYAIDLRPYVSDQELKDFFPTIIENNTVNGKLVGLPWFSDAPSLFYRSDLLRKHGFDKPPETWDELEEMAGAIQQAERQEGNLGFWGYVWQGRAYEGLTCNALEWQSSQGAGNILDDQGQPGFNNPKAQAAFERAAKWVGTISPPEVVNWNEEDSLFLWQKGDAAFMRNWSFAYATTRATSLADDFGVTSMPRGEGGTGAVLGGWQLMVSRYSPHPEAAAKLVKFLASEQEQKIRAMEGSQNPTLQSLYNDPEILKAVPFFADFDTTMEQVVRRPSSVAGVKYPEVSEAYWTAVHSILTGGDAAQALSEGEAKVREVLGK